MTDRKVLSSETFSVTQVVGHPALLIGLHSLLRNRHRGITFVVHKQI